MDIRTCGMISEVQVDKTLRVTRVWTKVTKAKAQALMAKQYRGRPLYETRETPRRIKPIVEVEQGPSAEGEQEDDS